MAKFQVQARVIDLLGAQQIANCPTAISELFKNAYDADASIARLDAYLELDQAVLWDDGSGMSEDEILSRWLVVAAPSRTVDKMGPGEVSTGGRPRQGEKGIGRLAISTVGDTLLLISKKPRSPFTALLINWNIVRNEHLLLSQVEVPMVDFDDPKELDPSFVRAMASQLREALNDEAQLDAWSHADGKRLRDLIDDQLSNLQVDKAALQRALSKIGRKGTLFFTTNLTSEFSQYIRPQPDEEKSSRYLELVQLLANFQNSFDTEASGQEDVFKAKVYRWDQASRSLVDVLEDSGAIVPGDLRKYDHQIDVEFDEWGRYSGTLEVYGQEEPLTPIDQQEQPSSPLLCGPFRLKLWYVQGRPDESNLSKDAFNLVSKKLDSFGGLMIYRDGLRVLPFGRPELDWLKFEERRSRGAGRYHFSYRRMFGFVALTREENSALADKAGREGFIQNKAYRQFQTTLIDFFSNIALRHFHQSEGFQETKSELKERRKL